MGNFLLRIQGRSVDRCPAALTPGILGRFDGADPNVSMSYAGNTCGPLGVGDDFACFLSKGDAATQSAPAPVAKVTDVDGMRVIESIFKAIDGDKDLKGAGVILKMAGEKPTTADGEPLRLRESDHASGLPTDVVVTISLAVSSKDDGWWGKWSGTILNCGGLALGVVGTAVSCSAAPITGGITAVPCGLAAVGTAGSAVQCTLAVGKLNDQDWATNETAELVDIGLDLMSLGLGIGMLKNAVKTGSSALKASKYASILEKTDKGKLIKTLERLEKLQADFGDLKKLLENGVKLEKVSAAVLRANPTKKMQLTNNVIRRMLPLATKQINRELRENLSQVIGTGLSLWSSHRDGVIDKFESLKIDIEIHQFVLGE